MENIPAQEMEFVQAVLQHHYGLQAVELKEIQRTDEWVLWVKGIENQLYKLKLFRTSAAAKKSQLLAIYKWIDFLAEQTDFRFPTLVTNLAGETITALSENTNWQWGTVQNWLDWSILPAYNMASLKNLGQFVAKLHAISENYVPDKNGVPCIDHNWIQESSNYLLDVASRLEMQQEECRQIEKNLALLLPFFKQLGEQPSVFGFIHSDIHRRNILEEKSSICLIDYEDTVRGHFMLDIGILFNEFLDYPDQCLDWQKSFLSGYQSIRSLDVEAQELTYFQFLGDMIYAAWIFKLYDFHLQVDAQKLQYGYDALQNLARRIQIS